MNLFSITYYEFSFANFITWSRDQGLLLFYKGCLWFSFIKNNIDCDILAYSKKDCKPT